MCSYRHEQYEYTDINCMGHQDTCKIYKTLNYELLQVIVSVHIYNIF